MTRKGECGVEIFQHKKGKGRKTYTIIITTSGGEGMTQDRRTSIAKGSPRDILAAAKVLFRAIREDARARARDRRRRRMAEEPVHVFPNPAWMRSIYRLEKMRKLIGKDEG